MSTSSVGWLTFWCNTEIKSPEGVIYIGAVHTVATGVKIIDRPKSVLTSWPHHAQSAYWRYLDYSLMMKTATLPFDCTHRASAKDRNGNGNEKLEMVVKAWPYTEAWSLAKVRLASYLSVYTVSLLCTRFDVIIAGQTKLYSSVESSILMYLPGDDHLTWDSLSAWNVSTMLRFKF